MKSMDAAGPKAYDEQSAGSILTQGIKILIHHQFGQLPLVKIQLGNKKLIGLRQEVVEFLNLVL